MKNIALNARKYLLLVTLVWPFGKMYARHLRNHDRKRHPIKSLLEANLFSMPSDDSVDDENTSSEFPWVSRVHVVYICVSYFEARLPSMHRVYPTFAFSTGRRRPTHEQSRSFTGERVLAFLNFTPRIGPGDRNS